MPYGKKSPAEMGHKSPMKKESAKQETKNLMKDMPVDKKASAMQMGHSPAEMGHSPMQNHHYGKRKASAVKMGHSPLEGHCMGSPAKMGHESPMEMAGSFMSKHSSSALHFNKPQHKHIHPYGSKYSNRGHGNTAITNKNKRGNAFDNIAKRNRKKDSIFNSKLRELRSLGASKQDISRFIMDNMPRRTDG